MVKDLLFRLRSLFRDRAVEGELDEELRFHVEKQAELYVNAGVAADEARRRAAVEFGGLAQTKERCREARGIAFVSAVWQDVKYGVRMLARSPAFTAVVVASLALGIGANTAIFSILDQALVRYLPVKDPERLVVFRSPGVNPGMDQRFRQPRAGTFSALPGVLSASFSSYGILGGGINIMRYDIPGFEDASPDEKMVYELGVSPGYFESLGQKLIAGRSFVKSDADAVRTVIVNQAFARKYFNGRSPVGQRIRWSFDRNSGFEIVGMVQDERYMDMRAEPGPFVYRPVPWAGAVTFYVRARHNPENLVAAIRREVQAEAPGVPLYRVTTMQKHVGNALQQERMIATLSAAFGLLATLLAAIGLYGVMAYVVTRRTREIGIRLALGAKRARVLSLVMSEVGVVIAAGLCIGVPGALMLSRYVQSQLYGIRPNDPATVAAAAFVVTAVAAVVGLLPARRASRIDPVRALRYE